MNVKQTLFVTYYTEGETKGNATQSAISAKYSKKTAYSQGQRLLKHVEVEQAIKDRTEAIEKAENITIEAIKVNFAQDRALCLQTNDRTNLIRVDENFAKHVGFYEKDNAQRSEQAKLDQAETEEAQRIANIILLEDAKKDYKAG